MKCWKTDSFIYTSQFSVFIHTQINKRLKLKYCYAKNVTSFPGPFPGLGAGQSQGKFNSNRGNSNYTHKNARELPFLRNIIGRGYIQVVSNLFFSNFFRQSTSTERIFSHVTSRHEYMVMTSRPPPRTMSTRSSPSVSSSRNSISETWSKT